MTMRDLTAYLAMVAPGLIMAAALWILAGVALVAWLWLLTRRGGQA